MGCLVEMTKRQKEKERIDLQLHGLENCGESGSKLMEWGRFPLSEGDEIAIRVVISPEITPPTTSRMEKDPEEDEFRYRQYLALKAYFADKRPL